MRSNSAAIASPAATGTQRAEPGLLGVCPPGPPASAPGGTRRNRRSTTAIEMPADRPAKEWAFIPALALLGVVVMLQRRRRVAP